MLKPLYPKKQITVVSLVGMSGMMSETTPNQLNVNHCLGTSAINEQLLDALVSSVPVIVYVLDLQGQFLFFKGNALEQLGLNSDELVGCSMWEFYRHQPGVIEQLQQCMTGTSVGWVEEIEGWVYEYRATPILAQGGQVSGVLAVATDITERQRAIEQLEYVASHDGLTGLPNRNWFLEQPIKPAAETQASGLCAVLLIDIDRFKGINESLGHHVGDLFLMATARRLKNALRSGDRLARVGGDEFAILLAAMPDIKSVVQMAEDLQQQIQMPISVMGQEVSATVSIGVAGKIYEDLDTQTEIPAELLREAGLAIRRAKQEGEGVVLFDAAMHQQAVQRWHIETDLRQAILLKEEESRELGEWNYSVLSYPFSLHYQPIISLVTGQISGFEALLRWQHPTRGFVSPAEFIPIAEETRLIIPLGWWVLQQACWQLCRWQQQFPLIPLTMSVNLSCHQLAQPHLVTQVERILKQTGCKPASLNLEITESCLHEKASTIQTLENLKTLGVNLAIDDFGTGYSSLSRLYHFPVHTLKIDRSFVSQMGISPGNIEIVRTIIDLGHNLGLEITAEGIETAQQYLWLQQLQCESAQGYFFSRPLEVNGATALLANDVHWET